MGWVCGGVEGGVGWGRVGLVGWVCVGVEGGLGWGGGDLEGGQQGCVGVGGVVGGVA